MHWQHPRARRHRAGQRLSIKPRFERSLWRTTMAVASGDHEWHSSRSPQDAAGAGGETGALGGQGAYCPSAIRDPKGECSVYSVLMTRGTTMGCDLQDGRDYQWSAG